VLGDCATEGGGIHRCRVRQALLARGLPGVGRELLEPGLCGDLQDSQRLVGSGDERARQPHGEQHEVAGPGLEGLAVTAELCRVIEASPARAWSCSLVASVRGSLCGELKLPSHLGCAWALRGGRRVNHRGRQLGLWSAADRHAAAGPSART
jgi:hypothetical protein